MSQPSTPHSVKARLLERAYAANRHSHVAFIDESYLPPAHLDAHGARLRGEPFYVATAYLAPCADHDVIRDDLLRIVGAPYWHTTEAHRKGDTHIIRELCRYIARATADEHIVVTVQRPISRHDRDAEQARAQCLRGLFTSISGSDDALPGVGLFVFEERRFLSQRNADERVIRALRSEGVLGRHDRVFGASPSYECLLWLPDIVSFAEYHRQTASPHDYLEPFQHRITYVDAGREPRLDGLR